MAAVAITNPIITVELKYNDTVMGNILDAVSTRFGIAAENRVASRENVSIVLFQWLKRAGTASSLGDGTTLTVTIDAADQTITANQLKAAITAAIPSGTIRGFAKELSIRLSTQIAQDKAVLETNPATLHTDANLHFPGSNLARRLTSRVATEVNKYFLSDAIDVTLLPEAVKTVLEEHAKVRADRSRR